MTFLGLDLTVDGGSDTWIAESLVAAGFLQRREKIFRVRRLHNISQSTSTEGLCGHLRCFVLAQNDYLGLRKHAADFPSSFKTIQIWHAEIHKNKIGQQHFGLLYRVVAVDGFATHVKVSLRQQEGPHTSSYYFMVIDYQNSHSDPRSGVENISIVRHYPAE